MRGILLAGGSGSRLWPLTQVVSKQLLPVYDKPMIYYPLSTLMLAGIRECLVISTPQDLSKFRQLLGDGTDWGLSLSFVIQEKPNGIAEALIIGERFIQSFSSALILGDNIFHGPGLGVSLARRGETENAEIFAYQVADASQYAVVALEETGEVASLEEKPQHPRSRWAVPGLYFYPPGVSEVARGLSPSSRGELEITDLNKWYLQQGRLSVTELPRGTAWLDVGTPSAISDASLYVRVLEDRQGTKISCPEEIAWRQGWIGDEDLERLAAGLGKSQYGDYLRSLLRG